MSKRWPGVAALAVSMSVVWLVFILYGFPWIGLMWVVSLASAAALWASQHDELSSPSIGQVIADLEAEPVPVIATPTRIAAPTPKAVL